MSTEYDPEHERDACFEQVHGWLDAFADSPQYERLPQAERDLAADVITAFADTALGELGVSPADWDQEVVAECCLDIMPRKVSALRPFFAAISPVLSAFFEFLAGQKLLKHGQAMARAVGQLQNQIIAASEEDTGWGPAKALVMAAERAGCDMSDEKAFQRFIDDYNQRCLARYEAGRAASGTPSPPPPPPPPGPVTPVRRLEPKVGRNDPCPCGSGKKFKKCCG